MADQQPSQPIERISAVTLATADMARAFRFYRSLGFILRYGGPDAGFSSFALGEGKELKYSFARYASAAGSNRQGRPIEFVEGHAEEKFGSFCELLLYQ